MTPLTTLPHALEPMVEAMADHLYRNIPEITAPIADLITRAALLAGLNAALESDIAKKGALIQFGKEQWVACELTEENRIFAHTALILNLGPKDSA